MSMTTGRLVLDDGAVFEGEMFGARTSISGEVVFNTGMVGYPESLTDPSYKGQILVLTYPLIGNYGVPLSQAENGVSSTWESDRIQVQGLVVSEYASRYSHWQASQSLGEWLAASGVPALSGVDTRAITKRIRDRGTMLGKLLMSGEEVGFCDPNQQNLVSAVGSDAPVSYGSAGPRVLLIDCGCKSNIIRNLLARGLRLVRVPWNYAIPPDMDYDGVVVSSGPGDPKHCRDTIRQLQALMEQDRPILGICLGHQLMALAAGADTYKLKFGHRSQNQPCLEVGTPRCYITSQNHGYAVRTETLPTGWTPWFTNANDGTNEGIRHQRKPFMSVQFHPEASPGPDDTSHIFDEFVRRL
ncbi:MAG: glutamine-hydrolyzing carbamoyl-phosphate synthase small subunit [Nitrospira sp.]|nr:MAG: glutamine-hydrolyzing carbamoyl-phosphate synthase small subunit [Nitrospira sp.]